MEAQEVPLRKDIELHFLPKNATHLCQPLDSFVIKTIKDIWKQKWNTEKYRLIRKKCFNEDLGNGYINASGKLTNPGKKYFLNFEADVIQIANQIVDEDGLNLVQKITMRCGLSLNKSRI